ASSAACGSSRPSTVDTTSCTWPCGCMWPPIRLTADRLHLAGGIVAALVWSRDLPSAPSSVRIYRDSLGHWYASFVVAAWVDLFPATGRVIGVDWGVTETATTTSDAHDLPHPRHGRNAATKLARYQ